MTDVEFNLTCNWNYGFIYLVKFTYCAPSQPHRQPNNSSRGTAFGQLNEHLWESCCCWSQVKTNTLSIPFLFFSFFYWHEQWLACVFYECFSSLVLEWKISLWLSLCKNMSMAKLLGNFQELMCGKNTIRESRELYDLFTQVKSESSLMFSFLLLLSYS